MHLLTKKQTNSTRTFLFSVTTLLIGACSFNSGSTYQGYVEGEFVYVASPYGGRLDELKVERGQNVQRNAPLFFLESVDEREAVKQAQENLKAAEAQLADLKKGKRTTELDVVKAQIAQAAANEKNSFLQLKRDEVQYEAGGIAKAQLDNANYLHIADAQKVKELEEQLASSELPAREDQIEAQAAQVSALQAALAQADWRLAQKSISATRTGLIFDTIYRIGEWVPAGQPVIQMLPPENVKVRFFVYEKQLGALKLNTPIKIKVDNIKKPFSGKITYISSQAEYTPPVIYSNETRSKLIYMVEARPESSEALTLHPGQPVQVIVQ